ncbi:MAG: tripartite tricarboxylate transporter TctB family protein [Rhodobacteraceae bacterium]|nr:tripartite tricarboxylate transporter TctB family protein [Alphaproteobacteria bacterium]MBT8477245.1 tripartite tricarboxylate transporter TctB family protein [Alphaproteobacteria bacterium]NNF72374.1 tripartite tricarboxylate transporter TctB family protein [Paracoccaceae bacterium]NNK66838.1 tripartite tricarboxylate transporter TctB family protein [Paracoccaceae bacterium]
MALDRWIALIFLVICGVYGYTAFFLMDVGMPPFMQRNPIWPSTFPKILSLLGVICSFVILMGFEKGADDPKPMDINYRRLTDYKLGQAILLISLMVLYAFSLRPVGFLASTVLFLVLSSATLGERRFHILIPVALIAAGGIWYLVQEVLGIFLRPWPMGF